MSTHAGSIRSSRASLAALLAVALGGLHPGAALGWGEEGHVIIAELASRQLTGRAKREVRALLGPGQSLADVANWADEKEQKAGERRLWHYVDIPTTATSFDPARDGHEGNNVIDQIIAMRAVLADRANPSAQRAEALKYLVHLVGDIHQPLHCAERLTARGRPDAGGNRVQVRFLGAGATTSLHMAWDVDLVRTLLPSENTSEYVRAVAGEPGGGPAAPITDDEGPPDVRVPAWAHESHRLACEVAYRGVAVSDEPVVLDERYVQRCAPVAQEQILKAGARLAALLNETLSPPR